MRLWKGLASVFGSYRRLIWITYGVQLILAIPLAIVTYLLLDETLGSTLSIDRLIGEFDYILWRDMLNHNSEALQRFLRSLGILLPMALIIAAILACGIYWSLHNKATGVKLFLEGIRKLWWRYLLISTIALVLVLLWSVLVWGWYFSNLFEYLEYWKKDSHLAWLGLGLFIVWTVGLYWLFIITNLAKVDQLNHQSSIFSSIRTSVRRSFSAARNLSVSLLTLALLGFVATVFYLAASSELKPSSVFVLFFLQQLTTWIKVGLRIASYEEVQVYAVSGQPD